MSDEPRPDDGWGGMGTGSERGAPGEHLPEPPLTEDEQRLLEELRRPAEGEPIVAAEDSPEVIEAVEDDTPLHADGLVAPAEDDPETAHFRAPGE
jgi:hypothetical protein